MFTFNLSTRQVDEITLFNKVLSSELLSAI